MKDSLNKEDRTVLYFIHHPHKLSTENVARVFRLCFSRFFTMDVVNDRRGTEADESGGDGGGVKRGVKSAFALQFGMTLII